jgi:hypothetical protein
MKNYQNKTFFFHYHDVKLYINKYYNYVKVIELKIFQ